MPLTGLLLSLALDLADRGGQRQAESPVQLLFNVRNYILRQRTLDCRQTILNHIWDMFDRELVSELIKAAYEQ
jgi:hypothetical protein